MSIKEEIKQLTLKEARTAVLDNFMYGYLAVMSVTFVANDFDLGILLGFYGFYTFLSKVVNRPKYVTKIGKFILFPVPATTGAYLGYVTSSSIVQWVIGLAG